MLSIIRPKNCVNLRSSPNLPTSRNIAALSLAESLTQVGYCTLCNVLTEVQLATICSDLESLLNTNDSGILRSREQAYGIRNLLQLWPAVVDLVQIPMVRNFVCQVMGDQVGVVRALLFDKPPGRSWTLPWHRDRTIAVRQIPSSLREFAHPTRKAGIPHLTAPNWLQSDMLTLRFSIDPMLLENGPLVVMPGSHRTVSNGDEDLGGTRDNSIETILCGAGDVFAMRPLLAHTSLRSVESTQLRRRVVHIELSNCRDLPDGLEWYEYSAVR